MQRMFHGQNQVRHLIKSDSWTYFKRLAQLLSKQDIKFSGTLGDDLSIQSTCNQRNIQKLLKGYVAESVFHLTLEMPM